MYSQPQSIGWVSRQRALFYGFKLHISTSEMGEIIDVMLTSSHTNNRKPLSIIFSALIVYNFSEEKLSLKTKFCDTKQLILPLVKI
ncbi:MAG: hypothetical protein GDA42_09320 [Ekhidna sp.]|nr:hypothetical protein [Ekhidna sp.]MBC6410639.1 hypothetical protein [Ekhidna sp.]